MGRNILAGTQAGAAVMLGLHENTIRARIRQAEELLPGALGATLLPLARPTYHQDGTSSFTENVVGEVTVEFVSPLDSYSPGET